MGRVCTICSHPARDEIDRALAAGASKRAIASRFSVSDSSVLRHKTDHLPATLKRDHEESEAGRADDLVDRVEQLHKLTMGLLVRAAQASDLGTALRGIGHARHNLELIGRLTGELDERPVLQQQTNILMTPEYVAARGVVMRELHAYPEVRQRVALELLKLEAANANDH